MVCQKCHKNIATLRYAEVVSGQVSELRICQSCYDHMQDDDTPGFEIAGNVPTPKKRKTLPERSRRTISRKTCPNCGLGLQSVLEEAVMGCRSCYDRFHSDINSTLEDMHGAKQHSGKTPQRDSTRERVSADLQSKRVLLRTALDGEHYEEAAELRDAITELESALGTMNGGEN